MYMVAPDAHNADKGVMAVILVWLLLPVLAFGIEFMVIKRVGVLSFAKIAGALYALLGLIAGAVIAAFALLGSAIGAASSHSAQPLFGALFGVGAILIFPVLYGVIGFFGGLIGSALYNLLAGLIGGIEVELQ